MLRNGLRAVIATLAVAATLALVAAPAADARIGGGFSSGSRGGRSFSAPPSTSTAPSASPFQRTTAQPGPSTLGQPRGSVFGGNRGFFGGGLLGGLAAGFIGAGLFGLLFGHGLFGGLGGLVSILGLLLQVGLIAFIGMMLWRFFQRRNLAYAGNAGGGPLHRDGSGLGSPLGSGLGSSLGLGSGSGARPAVGPGQRSDTVGIAGADYDAFERMLGEVQTAYGNEDLAALRARMTPELLSYFSEDLAQNASRGVVNRVSDVKLVKGDLSEAWSEGGTDYATVAMQFSIHDWMENRSGQVVEGDPLRPQQVTEFWTFRRTAGGPWMLSAIQQV
jgi:predicted lipid-binding transport protein (Tim44 family)